MTKQRMIAFSAVALEFLMWIASFALLRL